MSTEYNKSQKIEDVLTGLDGIRRASAPAFFYTRLKARMESELDNGGPIARLLTRPALALSIAAIVLILNAAVILQLWQQEPAMNNDGVAVIVADYSMGTYPVYEENP